MKKKPSNILAFIKSQIWCIEDGWLSAIHSIANRDGLLDLESQGLLPEAISSKIGQPLDNTHSAKLIGSTAVIPIRGVITPRATMFSDISGLTSSEGILQDFNSALKNPNVESIVLQIDSPGGATTGVADVADAIFDARGIKPITAHVVGSMASAALWIGSSADKIVASSTAMIGSIGTVATLSTGQEEGTIEIVSNLSKNKRLSPESKEGRDAILEILDGMTSIFINAVARNRGITNEEVNKNFGQGLMFLAPKALEIGLIDELGSFDSVLSKPQGTTTTQQKEISAMEFTKENIEANAPDVADAFRAEGQAKAEKTFAADGSKAILKADRERIATIMANTPKGMETEASEAINSGISAGDFALSVLSAQGKKNASIDSANDDDANSLTNLGGGTAPDDSKTDAEKADDVFNAVLKEEN